MQLVCGLKASLGYIELKMPMMDHMLWIFFDKHFQLYCCQFEFDSFDIHNNNTACIIGNKFPLFSFILKK